MKSSLPPPTSAQKRRIKIIKQETGCIACYIDSGIMGTPCDAHHIIDQKTGKRMGHDYVLGLCPHKHHRTGEYSIHGGRKKFIERYGSEAYLWKKQNSLVAGFEGAIIR